MTRATQTVTLALLVASIYLALYQGLIPLPALVQEEVVPYLPFWALITFGAYLLGSLAWGVLTFKEKEAEYHALKDEIEMARKDLRAKGVDVD